jgi:hypothetical protein
VLAWLESWHARRRHVGRATLAARRLSWNDLCFRELSRGRLAVGGCVVRRREPVVRRGEPVVRIGPAGDLLWILAGR